MRAALKPTEWSKPRVAVVSAVSHEQRGLPGRACSCGWKGFHIRSEKLEDKVDRHLDRRHGGQGLRLY